MQREAEEGVQTNADPVEFEPEEDRGLEDTGESGTVKPHMLCAPYEPSRQERIEHDLTHMPFRSWCPDCVAGKGVSHGHRTVLSKEESSIPLIGVDYAFLKKSDEIRQSKGEVTTTVIKDQRSKCVFPVPVPSKGMDAEEYGARQMLKVLDFLGVIRGHAEMRPGVSPEESHRFS